MPAFPLSSIPHLRRHHHHHHHHHYLQTLRTHLPQNAPTLIPLLLLLLLFLLPYLTTPTSPSTSTSTSTSESSPAAIAQAVARASFTPSITSPRPLVLVTALNYPFRHYLTNLNCSLSRLPFKPPLPLVIAMDPDIHHYAQTLAFPSIRLSMPSSLLTQPKPHHVHLFGSKQFNLLSKQKLYAVYKLLQLTAVDVLFTDADIIFCANAPAQIAHIMYNTDWSKDPFSPRQPHLLMQTAWPRSLLNSGFYYARASPHLLDAFRAFLAHDADSENDQVIVNAVMCRKHVNGNMVFNGTNAHPAAPHRPMPVLCTWDGRVDARLLPAQQFPTGGELVQGTKIFHNTRRFITDSCDNGHFAVLHNNCILSSKKKARFVAKGMWFVADDDQTCLNQPAPATIEARKRCGGAKCGPEGDLKRFPNLVV